MKTIVTLIIMLLSVIVIPGISQEIRPIRDDIGFCWDKVQMDRFIDYFRSTDPQKDEKPLSNLIAGISPHDDILYAGPTYYPLYKQIKTKEVVIFGVTHGTVRKEIGDPQEKLIFDSYKYWKGPYNLVEISPLREYITSRLSTDTFIINNKAHDLEHSIEAQIPFLQHFNPNIRITPIMVTGMDFQKMDKIASQLASIIAAYIKENKLQLGKDIFFIMSADANHYGKDFNNTLYGEDEKAHQIAIDRDKKIADTCLTQVINPEKIQTLTTELWGQTYKDYKDTYWCGKYSIPFGMLSLLHIIKDIDNTNELTGTLLAFNDTYSSGVVPLTKTGCGITAVFSLKHWVSFLSTGFQLSKKQ